MTTRATAERILFGTSLADKLAPLGRGDVAPGTDGSWAVPTAPGRPPGIVMRRDARSRPPTSLRTERDRGRVLHAFANHELLALELMALALLRFPDEPPGLHRALVATMRDEQSHLRDYLARMDACGVELGDQPVSTVFWDALSDAPHAAAFLAGMSLGFEQANLDFSRHWATAFRAAGDTETADVLDRVYADEVRHVRAGLHLFRKLKEPGRSDWDAWTAALRFPLTPARARGPEFDRDGRRAAGLDDAFVRRLAVTGMSRGRPPVVHVFDPHVEDEVAGRAHRTSPAAHDLRMLPVLLAGADDVVVAAPPSLAFLERLVAAGIGIPQLVDRPDPALLPNGRAGGVRAWGPSPGAARRFGTPWDPRWAVLGDKTWAAQRLCALDPDGPDLPRVCATLAKVERAVAAWPRALIKAPYSASGGHRVEATAPLPRDRRRWVERALTQGPVRVDPVHDVLLELSTQLEIRGGHLRELGTTRFGAARGAYRGTVLGPPTLGVSSELARFLHAGALDRVSAAARVIAAEAVGLGYEGPLGVDALVVAGPRLVAVNEVNARTTMGRLALALRRRLAPATVGVWWFLPVRSIHAAGWTPRELVAEGDRVHPTETVGGRLAAGVLPLSDPDTASAVLALAWVGRRLPEVLARWEVLCAAAPAPAPLWAATRWITGSERPPRR